MLWSLSTTERSMLVTDTSVDTFTLSCRPPPHLNMIGHKPAVPGHCDSELCESSLAEDDALGGHSVRRLHQHVGGGQRLRHDVSDEELRIRQRNSVTGGLAVGHGGRALSADDDRHVEAVVGESGGGAGHAERLGERVPGLLTEDGVHQLDHLVLWGEHIVR
ncbi:hypothetical protein F7725_016512 [Dissostichus mawsoni]|uniref:Uncharacterized protein n=1 Tax=Dissostichus mawsoni TaxID=36200 RepID=A0A7J5Z3Y4_DISMA|nr:hypothetical protein F7725_016512 [Dissostichus mawsoni]